MTGSFQLKVAALLSFIAAILHIAVIFGGPDWYRFFGAGEEMAQLAETGSIQPTIITLLIAVILSTWALYALSGAGIISRLPLLKLGLSVITIIYLVRGVAGLFLPFISDHPAIMQNSVVFWLVSSTLSCIFGIFYLLGTKNSWQQLTNNTGTYS
jgi:hypothetical protein